MTPAYIPNSLAVIAGGEKPIDNGYKIGENRFLGDGKTWRGTIVGTIGGFSAAIILNLISPVIREAGFSVEPFTIQVAFALAFGSILGDICASFIKRLTGRSRGSSFLLLDQLDFVVGALTVSLILEPDWIINSLSLESMIVMLVVSPLIHVSANVIGYKIGLKKEPY